MSKLSASSVRGFINTLLSASSLEDGKKRNFVETIELQIGLKNYDPQRDKRCVPSCASGCGCRGFCARSPAGDVPQLV